MQLIDFGSLFLEGKVFDFYDKTSEAEIIKKLGNPSEIEDYGKSGKFLHYDDFRFSILNDELDFVDCFFMNTEASFYLQVKGHDIIINKDTGLVNMLNLLNLIGLKWNIPYEDCKLDYLIIEVINGLRIYYYYENGNLEKITRMYCSS